MKGSAVIIFIGSAGLRDTIDEYAFRFNCRTSRSRGLLFYRLVQQAVAVQPTWYRDIVGGKHYI
jgi:hypothetical protein